MSANAKDPQQLAYVGQRILRKDGPEKVTGRAKYTGDIQLPGMLVGRILRSPHAHARILNIDTALRCDRSAKVLDMSTPPKAY